MGPALVHFVNRFYWNPGIAKNLRRTSRCNHAEAHRNQVCGNLRDELLVVLVDADEGDAGLRQYGTRTDLRLDVRFSEGVIRRP